MKILKIYSISLCMLFSVLSSFAGDIKRDTIYEDKTSIDLILKKVITITDSSERTRVRIEYIRYNPFSKWKKKSIQKTYTDKNGFDHITYFKIKAVGIESISTFKSKAKLHFDEFGNVIRVDHYDSDKPQRDIKYSEYFTYKNGKIVSISNRENRYNINNEYNEEGKLINSSISSENTITTIDHINFEQNDLTFKVDKESNLPKKPFKLERYKKNELNSTVLYESFVFDSLNQKKMTSRTEYFYDSLSHQNTDFITCYTNDSVVIRYKRIEELDSNLGLNRTVLFYWNDFLTDWVLKEKLSYIYTTDSLISEKFNYNENGVLINAKRDVELNLTNNNKREYLTYKWNVESSAWQISSKDICVKDDSARTITYSYYHVDSKKTHAPLELYSQSIDRYSKNNRRNDYLSLDINKEGLIDTTRWSEIENSKRGQVLSEIEYGKTNDGKFTIVSKYTNKYDCKGRLVKQIEYLYSEIDKKLIPTFKKKRTYLKNNTLGSEQSFKWSEEMWVPRLTND